MSDFKARLLSQEVLLGTMISEIATPNIPRMMKAGGFAYIILDCEHGYFDYSQIAAITAVSNGIDLPVIIRIPEIRREVITKVLDMGANGLLVPMVETASDIEKVVNWSKYSPLGHRGISTQRAHTEYSPPPLAEYMDKANHSTMILAQIETRKGIGNLDDIAAVNNVDALIVGPNDLASDCGTPGKFNTQEMQSHIDAVINSARKAKKASGIISGSIPFLQDCRKRGMTFFSCGSEVSMIISGAKNTCRQFDQLN